MTAPRAAATMSKRKDPQIGGLFGDWLKAESIFDEVTSTSIKGVVAWQLQQARNETKISKAERARRMDTSRTQLDRLLGPKNGNVALDTLPRVAAMIGRKLRPELV